jgi:phosphoenolpyruvate-protein phosphotransferase (PTS system enzyme I)
MAKRATEIHLEGIKISEGISFAKICLFNDDRHQNVAIYKVSDHDRKKEKERLARAMRLAVEQIEKLVTDVELRIGAAESKIFVAQKMILQDESVQDEMFDEIERAGTNAEGAVIHILDRYESRLLDVDDEYIKTRATDIGEIKRRILDVLREVNPALQCMGQANCEHGKDRVIVARELTPSLTISLDTKNAAGFVTEHGGKLSHAAILAKSLGIPAVSGIKNILNYAYCGTEILVDGYKGEVFIWPSEKTIEKYNIRKFSVSKKMRAVEPVSELQIFANINLAADADEARELKAEGIGLYRTEFEFLAQGRLLSEDEQFVRYATVVKAMSGKPVYFRLLDIGGDKGADFFKLPRESNPYLGFRGSRFLLARPELLLPQVRALARASELGPVYILYPMIVDIKQFLTLKDLVCTEIKGMKSGEIRHGVMFEVPSACLDAANLLALSDFASIGSNDLIQYLFAVDRNNEHVAYDFSPDRDIFWSLIRSIAEAARKADKPLSICGEIAGSRLYLGKLMEIGIRNISVSTRLITELRNHIAKERTSPEPVKSSAASSK